LPRDRLELGQLHPGLVPEDARHENVVVRHPQGPRHGVDRLAKLGEKPLCSALERAPFGKRLRNSEMGGELLLGPTPLSQVLNATDGAVWAAGTLLGDRDGRPQMTD
jgi:hypothetical protein